MARGRMLRPSISLDPAVNSMSDFAQLLFTWMIAHADDYGVLPGNPLELWATVIPFKVDQRDKVPGAIQEMSDAGLIHYYSHNKKQYIQFVKWEQNQQGLHKRSAPKNPMFPGNSGKFPDLPPELEQELELEQEQEVLIPVDNVTKLDPFDFWNTHFYVVGSNESTFLAEWRDKLPDDVIVAALQLALDGNKRNVSYVRAVLETSYAEGVRDMHGWTSRQARFRERHKNDTKNTGSKAVRKAEDVRYYADFAKLETEMLDSE